jgi:hypothetical protein
MTIARQLPAASYAGIYHNDFVGDAVVAEEGGKFVMKLGPKPRAFPLTHFDRDTFTYQPEGEMSAGPSGVTFRIGPDRVADTVTIENLNVHGSGTLTRVSAEKALSSDQPRIAPHRAGRPGRRRRIAHPGPALGGRAEPVESCVAPQPRPARGGTGQPTDSPQGGQGGRGGEI